MPFDPTLAAIRFGTGLSPLIPPPASVDEMLGALAGADRMAARFPIPIPMEADPTETEWRGIQRERRLATESLDPVRLAAAQAAFDAARDRQIESRKRDLVALLSRMTETTDGFRERLVRFWADHFTMRAKAGVTVHLVAPTVELTIRPHVTGRFSDMLKAVVTSPMMMQYLDQTQSIGPNSVQGLAQGRGLNENLAREALELHTLGVGGAYAQTDIRQLAELLTGMSYGADGGFTFQPRRAEPGSETVLGVTYGDKADQSEIFAVMGDLAVHPDTARHIARKLVVHFVSDDPDPALVAALAARFTATEGDLGAVSAELLRHPAAWGAERRKVKQPIGFIGSALRALGVTGDMMAAMTPHDLRQRIEAPLRIMGQDWEKPVGPDGWAEDAEAWISPQGMAGRIDWAIRMPSRFRPDLPDPRDFARVALGPDIPQEVAFAAAAAEDRGIGIGVVLASAAFQRR